ELLHYILKRIHQLYRHEASAMEDFADFVLGLIKDIRGIETSKENLEKIIDLAVSSISTFRHQINQKVI
ncbi:transcriptional regulator, partial [bacterium]|nr:transcriptional regulator [bacterium]